MSTSPLAPRIGTATRWHVEETDYDGKTWRLDDIGDFASRQLAFARFEDLDEIGRQYNLPNRLRVVKTTLKSEVVG